MMFFKKVLAVTTILAASSSAALAVTITDSFIGSGDFAGGGRDVIGDPAIFDTTKAEFTLSADRSFLTLKIFSNYLNNIGALGTAPGALFLNTSKPGTHVAGSDGASWNYGVKANNGANPKAGASSIYALNSQDALLMADSFNTGLWSAWRTNQEVDVNSQFASLSGNSSWEILNAGTSDVSLSFYIPVDFIGGASILLNDISFSWSMTCANDVIRGSAKFQPVPEPGTMFLLGLGAVGVMKRRRAINS